MPFVYVAKDWSEANQLRDPHGKFAGTRGGSGGGTAGGAGAEIEQEIVANRKYDPNAWYADEANAPWNRPKEDFERGEVPGFKMGADRRSTQDGAGGGDVLGGNDGSGYITVTPAYFNAYGGAQGRKLLIEHEVGHDIQRALSKQGREEALLKPWNSNGKTGNDARYDLPWLGSSNKPGHEALAWSYNELWDGFVGSGEKQALLSEIAATAKRMNTPVPVEWGGVAKTLKEWSEAVQLRDPRGRFAGTIGGGGGGGSAGAAGAEEENPYVAGQQLNATMDQIPEGQWNDRIGDPRLADVMREQGYFSPGNVYTKEQMDAFVKAGEIEVLRGTSKEKYATDIIDSKGAHPYTGTGVHGNGLYAAGIKSDRIQADYDAQIKKLGDSSKNIAVTRALEDTGVFTAIDYAGTKPVTGQFEGGIVRMTLRPEAKIVKKFDLLGQVGNPDTIKEFDLGRIAALKGYDAISIPRSFGPEHYVILNRSVLRIQDTPWTLGDYLPDFKE